MKATNEEILEALDGNICDEQATKMRIIRSHIQCIEDCKAELESKILSLVTPYIEQIDLLCTIPGISLRSACHIIGEIGVDMSVFPTAKNLCSWAGLAPQNDQSAGKKKTTRISRAGIYLKPLLVQCANAAIKSTKKHPEIVRRFQELKKRRGYKKAIIAIARMLLTIIYNVLKKHEAYDPQKFSRIEVIPENRIVSLEEAMYILQRQGYSITIPENSIKSKAEANTG